MRIVAVPKQSKQISASKPQRDVTRHVQRLEYLLFTTIPTTGRSSNKPSKVEVYEGYV